MVRSVISSIVIWCVVLSLMLYMMRSVISSAVVW